MLQPARTHLLYCFRRNGKFFLWPPGGSSMRGGERAHVTGKRLGPLNGHGVVERGTEPADAFVALKTEHAFFLGPLEELAVEARVGEGPDDVHGRTARRLDGGAVKAPAFVDRR